MINSRPALKTIVFTSTGVYMSVLLRGLLKYRNEFLTIDFGQWWSQRQLLRSYTICQSRFSIFRFGSPRSGAGFESRIQRESSIKSRCRSPSGAVSRNGVRRSVNKSRRHWRLYKIYGSSRGKTFLRSAYLYSQDCRVSTLLVTIALLIHETMYVQMYWFHLRSMTYTAVSIVLADE